ncbi:MAG: hypothetical protein JNK85_14430 [Verrucomicrobiales bacterium]|nr:hypothetical protein [Verrucomicrobiales bacterium]
MDETLNAVPAKLWLLRSGWLGLLFYLMAGIGLEVLHGWKVPWYLDVGQSSRRLMWTLAHTHGSLFSVVAVVAAVSLPWVRMSVTKSAGCVAWGIMGGQVLMPLGFFLGGVWLKAGEPGVGVFLVPIGAAMMLMGVAGATWAVWARDPSAIGQKR